MECLDGDEATVNGSFHTRDAVDGVQHFLAGQRFPLLPGLVRQMNFLALDRIQRDEAVFHCHIHNHPQDIDLHLLALLGEVLAVVEVFLDVRRRDVFHHHFTECGIQMNFELVFVVLGGQRADGGLFEDIKPVLGVVEK